MKRWMLGALVGSLVLAPMLQAEPSEKDVQALVAKGYDFLKKQQGADGSFSPQRAGPGITALVVAALLRSGYGPDDPVVSKALGYLEKNVQKDGGI
ncbi:MAG: prenyltransferase/squalene oxidase repeat-containing protein, partial [Gemmataceae bacterium]